MPFNARRHPFGTKTLAQAISYVNCWPVASPCGRLRRLALTCGNSAVSGNAAEVLRKPAVRRQGRYWNQRRLLLCRDGAAMGRLIVFGVRGYKRSTSRDVNLFSDRAQAGGKTILEVTAVAACPFCGEAIQCCSRPAKFLCLKRDGPKRSRR